MRCKIDTFLNLVSARKNVFLTSELPLGFLVTKATKETKSRFFLDETQYFDFNYGSADLAILEFQCWLD